jgi:hypothetical protein
MGAAASVTTPISALQLRAFNVAKDEFERIKSRLHEEKRDQLEDYECLPLLNDSLLSRRLLEVYKAALVELELELTECKNPCVLQARMAELSVEDKKAYMNAVVLSILDRERASYKPKVVADYSKSFSGSAADTKAEKEAAALMKGEGGPDKAEVDDSVDPPDCDPYLRRPRLTRAGKGAAEAEQAACKALYGHDAHILRELCGMYLKFLAPSGCFMYIHSATKDVVSLRPNSYDEEEDLGGGITLANEQIAAEQGRGKAGKAAEEAVAAEDEIPDDVRVCSLQDLPKTIEEIIDVQGKTPLILDVSTEQKVRVFMEYKHRSVDVSALTVPFGKSGLKRTDVMENCRKTLVGALKSGTMFCLYLGDCNIEHADFKNKLCKKDCFPVDIFQQGGQKLFSNDPDGNPRYHAIYKEADLDAGKAVARENTFRACVVSSLHPREWYEKLQDCLPTGYLVPVYVSE